MVSEEASSEEEVEVWDEDGVVVPVDEDTDDASEPEELNDDDGSDEAVGDAEVGPVLGVAELVDTGVQDANVKSPAPREIHALSFLMPFAPLERKEIGFALERQKPSESKSPLSSFRYQRIPFALCHSSNEWNLRANPLSSFFNLVSSLVVNKDKLASKELNGANPVKPMGKTKPTDVETHKKRSDRCCR